MSYEPDQEFMNAPLGAPQKQATWGDRIDEIKDDLKWMAKKAIEYDDTELAQSALKTFHEVCDFKMEVEKWNAEDFPFDRPASNTKGNQS